MSNNGLTKGDLQQALAEQSRVILDAVSEKFETLEGEMAQRFDEAAQEREQLNRRFLNLTEKLDKFIERTVNVEKQLSDIQAQFASLKERVDRLEQ